MRASMPTHFLAAVLASWLNRQQQAVIEYLLEENQVLRSQLKGRRLRSTDEDHAAFRGLLERAGVESVRTPPHSPNCNAHVERFHGSLKREVAERSIFLGEDHL